MPLAAQSPWAAAHVGHGYSGALLYMGERSDPLYEELWALLRTDEMAEMGIDVRLIQANSPYYAKWARELGLAPDSVWALADNKGRRLLQGNKPPSATEMRNALDAAGVRSPVRVLRDFLRQHPDHLDAKRDLLSILRTIAERRTRRALQLDMKPAVESLMGTEEANNSFELWYSMLSSSKSIDTSPLEGKQLNPEQDIQIWGPYAQELQTLYARDDWRLVRLPWVKISVPVEACSPTMVQTYRRHIPRLETRLEEAPSNSDFWLDYGWAVSITKQRSVRSLFERLVPSPNTRWPVEDGLSLLAAEERAKNNWGVLAETLMSNWPRFRFMTYEQAETPRLAASGTLGESLIRARLEVVWRDYLNTLLESLIKTNRIQEAEAIIADVARYPVLRDIQRRAAELALSCGRNDLRDKWLALQIPEKPAKPDMADLEMRFYSNPGTVPDLVMINAEESVKRQAGAMLGQGGLFEWRVNPADLGPALSELMRQKEGWPVGVAYWALFDSKKSLLAHGPGLPAEAALIQALEQSNIEAPVNALRRFVREHPAQFEAKERFLRQLKLIAEQRTKEKLGADAGKNQELTLTEEEDRAIWGEYAAFYRQVLPYYLKQGRTSPSWSDNSCDSEYFVHSQTMKNLAKEFLPLAEDSLAHQPADAFLWGAWAALSDLSDNKPFKQILENIVPSPAHNDPSDFPPRDLRQSLLERYSERSDWRRVIDLEEWHWEAARGRLELIPEEMYEFIWSQEIQFLLEAYLRLEKNSEANELARIWSQSPAWPQIKQSAADLAEECEKPALAEQWKKL